MGYESCHPWIYLIPLSSFPLLHPPLLRVYLFSLSYFGRPYTVTPSVVGTREASREGRFTSSIDTTVMSSVSPRDPEDGLEKRIDDVMSVPRSCVGVEPVSSEEDNPMVVNFFSAVRLTDL